VVMGVCGGGEGGGGDVAAGWPAPDDRGREPGQGRPEPGRARDPRISAEAADDPSLTGRTFVLHTEVAEGGWGARGTAMGRADFDRLNAALRQ
jgi:hypothetical protein